MNPSYTVTTSLKEAPYDAQKELRTKINPKTNKKFTLAQIIEAGTEVLCGLLPKQRDS